MSLFLHLSFLLFLVEMTSEHIFQATVQILSGVEVLLCTPDCLLQLIEKSVAQLDSLAYLVYSCS